jgi:hypothetical protein
MHELNAYLGKEQGKYQAIIQQLQPQPVKWQ